MKVIWVSRAYNGKIYHGTKDQMDSLIEQGLDVDSFLIEENGLRSYLQSILKIRKIITEGNYDIIHAVGGHSGLAVIFAGGFKKLCVSYLGSDVQGTLTSNYFLRIVNFMVSYFIRLSAIFPCKIITKSNRMMSLLTLRARKKCYVIPNGVNFEKYKPIMSDKAINHVGLNKSIRYILFLGNKKSENKNYKLAKKAFDLLNQPNIELLSPYPVNHSKIPFYLNASNVLLLTSYKEGSPNVIKEAMACNCPIVATDVGDVREIIQGTDNCFITEYDSKEIAILLNKILNNGNRTNGRSNIRHLKREEIAIRIKDVYREIINKNKT